MFMWIIALVESNAPMTTPNIKMIFFIIAVISLSDYNTPLCAVRSLERGKYMAKNLISSKQNGLSLGEPYALEDDPTSYMLSTEKNRTMKYMGDRYSGWREMPVYARANVVG